MEKHEFKTPEGPHQFTHFSKKKIMWYLIIALVPTAIFSVYNFGLNALYIILISIFVSTFTEGLFNYIRKKPLRIIEGSAIVTGLLLAMTLSSDVPLWIPAIGAFIAIGLGKHVFGGTGCAIFNPALVGRAFLGISFSGIVNTYHWPSILSSGVDATTSATPMGLLQHKGIEVVYSTFGSKLSAYLQMFIGNISGSMGETSALLLLIGGILLIVYKIIDWRIPTFYIGTVFILTFLLGQDPIFHILGGGLFLGAFYMATGYEGIPVTKKGRIIAAIMMGLITVSIRLLGSMPEGVAFSILMANAATPLIDRFTIIKPFGFIQKKEFRLFNKKIKIKKTA